MGGKPDAESFCGRCGERVETDIEPDCLHIKCPHKHKPNPDSTMNQHA